MTTDASLSGEQTGGLGGLAPAVIVGIVVVGVLLAVVLAVAIVVVVLYLVRRKQEEDKSSAGRMGYGKVSALGKLLFIPFCEICQQMTPWTSPFNGTLPRL